MLRFQISRLLIFSLLMLGMSITPISTVAHVDQLPLFSATCTPPPTGAITGQVTAADTGQPLASVIVRAYLGITDIALDATDQSGHYVLTRLRPGNYTVQFANKPPYGGEWYNNQPTQTTATSVMVSSGMTTTAINGALDLGTVISGVVTAADSGVVLKDVSVRIYDLTGEQVGSGVTNTQGQYKIEGLMSGGYQLSFQPLAAGAANAYLGEWYNDKSEQTSADIVSVVAPNVVSDINVSLARGGQISGQVTAADTDSRLSNVAVRIYDSAGMLSVSTNTNAVGSYTTPALPGGGYTINFEPSNFGAVAPYLGEWYNDKPNQTAADIVNVTVPNVTTNVDAVLIKGGAISGKVTAAETGANLTNISVSVYNLAGDLVGTDSIDTSGIYTVTGLPSGDYKVRFVPFGLSRDYVPEWYSSKSNETIADNITVNAPNTTVNINAVLDKGGQIRGRVTAEESSVGLGNVSVRLYDQQGHFFDSLSTNASGYYTVTAVATGNYFVAFEPSRAGVAANYLAEWYNNKPDRSSADSVPVTAPNVTANIDAALGVGSRICGTVTASDTGAPLDDVTVDIYNAAGQYQGLVFTDESGNYVTPALPNGSYKLEFDPLRNGDAAAYFPEWYNDKPNQASADPIVLTGPNADIVVNATLAKGGQISGKVTLTDASSGMGDVDITVYDQNNHFAGSANVDTTGMYTTTALPVGNYKILAQPEGDGAAQSYALQWYNNKPNQSDADLAAVSALNVVRDVDFALTPGGRIAGKVTAADTGVGLDDVSISIYDADGKYVGFAGADANGDYSTPALRNGSYKLRFSPFGDADSYADEWYNDKSALSNADPIHVIAPTVLNNTNITLTKQAVQPLQLKVFLPLIQQ